MRNFSIKALAAICGVGISLSSFAGNKDRTGQAAAPEMTINPWARSTGLFGMNTASVSGMEAMKGNVAGMAQDSATDIGVSHGLYLYGTDISINDIAIAQKMGDAGVIGLNVMSMSFGDITETNFYNPQGYGTYHPQFLNFELAYAKQFSTHINAGADMTYVSEQVSNISAQGIAFAAGIQYVTGERNNFHFGVTLCNLGTNMRFTGTGFTISGTNPQNIVFGGTTNEYPSDKFDMPTYLNIGLQYDFYLDAKHLSSKNSVPIHRLSVIADFQSNSFNKDNTGVGLEYGFRDLFMLRAAYQYQEGIGDPSTSTTMYLGVAMGLTVQKRIGSEKGPMLAFDYSFRPTVRPANGVHMFTLRLTR